MAIHNGTSLLKRPDAIHPDSCTSWERGRSRFSEAITGNRKTGAKNARRDVGEAPEMSTVVRRGDRTAPTHQALPRFARARERNGTGVVPTSRLMELISCPSPKPIMTRKQIPTANPEVDFALIAKMIRPMVAAVAPMRSVLRRFRERSMVPENEPRNRHDKSNPDCLSCKCQYAETKGRRDPMKVHPAPVRDMVTSQMLELAWIRSFIRRSYLPRYRNDQHVEKYFDNLFQANVTRPTCPPAWLGSFSL